MDPEIEAGIFKRGLVIREDHLKKIFDIEDWRSLRDRLGLTHVAGCKIGKHRWYSTTMICRCMERLILDEQSESED